MLTRSHLFAWFRLSWRWQLAFVAVLLFSLFQTRSMLAVSPGHSDALGNETEDANVTVFLPIITKPGPWKMVAPMNVARGQHTATLLPNGKVLVVGGTKWGEGTLNSAEAFDPNSETWTMLAPMSVARENHTAILLPSGKVLVAGGTNGYGHGISSVEIYDPAMDAWETVAPMNIARHDHTATLLANGKVLVAGGYDSTAGDFNSAEIYDPGTNTWTMVASMNATRFAHIATLLPNNKVLVVGGVLSGYMPTYLFSAEVYDPETNTWTFVASMNTARSKAAITVLPSGKVLVAGGSNRECLASSEVYDLETNTWTQVGWLNYGHCLSTMLVLTDGKVLVAGGVESAGVVETWNPAQDSWTVRTPMQAIRSSHTMTQLLNGKVLVAGGYDYSYGGHLSSAEVYDPTYDTGTPENATWTVLDSMEEGRYLHTTTILEDNKVLIVGGSQAGESFASVEIYDVNLNTWMAGASLITPRQNHAAIMLPDGKVLVVGGTNSLDAYFSSAEVYDPEADSWKTVGAMNIARSYSDMLLLPNGKVLIAGGYNYDLGGYLSNAEVYDPAAETWTPIASMNEASVGHTMTLLPDGRVLVVGGLGTSGSDIVSLARAEVYDPDLNTWTLVASLNTGRNEHFGVLLPSGKVLVAGGGNYEMDTELSSTEIYDPDTDTWTETGAMAVVRTSFAGVLLSDGRVLVTGGSTHFLYHTAYLNSAEIYDPNTGIWTGIEPMSVARVYHTAILLPNGNVLIIGGWSPGEGFLNLVLQYDPEP